MLSGAVKFIPTRSAPKSTWLGILTTGAIPRPVRKTVNPPALVIPLIWPLAGAVVVGWNFTENVLTPNGGIVPSDGVPIEKPWAAPVSVMAPMVIGVPPAFVSVTGRSLIVLTAVPPKSTVVGDTISVGPVPSPLT